MDADRKLKEQKIAFETLELQQAHKEQQDEFAAEQQERADRFAAEEHERSDKLTVQEQRRLKRE